MIMQYTNEQIDAFKAEFNETKVNLNEMVKGRVLGGFRVGIYAPLQFIRIDALDPKDYPNNISENSVFVEFEVDFAEHKVELRRTGAVYLSPKDANSPQYRYQLMKSVQEVAEGMGVKKFRKSKFKDAKHLATKMVDYYNKVMECVTEYTGGYPYTKGIEK